MSVEAKEFIGKYYEEKELSDEEVFAIKEQQQLQELEKRWVECSNILSEDIKYYEKHYETSNDIEHKNSVLRQLKNYYECYKTSKDYLAYFNSANNLPLLEKLFNNGKFVSLEEAKKLKNIADTELYTQTKEYKDSESQAKFLEGFLYILLLSTCLFGSIYFGGFSHFLYGSEIAVFLLFGAPIHILFGSFWIPALVNAIYFKDGKKSKAYEEESKSLSNFMAGCGIALGAHEIHTLLKSDKKKK